MTNPSQNSKKKKITFSASKEGLEKAEKALVRLGFESKINFAKSQLLSRGTVTKFFNRQSIQLDSFKRICEALKLNWQEIAGIGEESLASSQLERQINPSLGIEQGVGTVQTSVRQVIAVDEQSQEVLVAVTLEGDIVSVQSDAVAFHSYFSKEYPGSTIKVVAIQKGSIRLIIKGYSKDIQKLLSDFESENITEINGFPVQDIQILSESSEDEESSEQKWRLVREIITNPIEGRDLSGADLSDADLSGVSLINANLSYADLSNADLSGADLSGADLSGADFSGTDLSGADLSGVNWSNGNLSVAKLQLKLAEENLKLLQEFKKIHEKFDVSLSVVEQYRLAQKIHEMQEEIQEAEEQKIREIPKFFANRIDTNFIYANLSGANLIYANLSGANLIYANLSDANLSDANLSDANLSGANVENARFSENQGISEQMKQDLIKRGAIFEDSPGDRSFLRA